MQIQLESSSGQQHFSLQEFEAFIAGRHAYRRRFYLFNTSAGCTFAGIEVFEPEPMPAGESITDT